MPKANISFTSSDFKNGNYLILRLGSTLKLSDKDTCSLKAGTIYNSFYNVTSSYGNNTYGIKMPGWSSFHTFTIPDGFYDISALSQLIQFQMMESGLFLTQTTTGKMTTFLELQENVSAYGCTLIMWAIPTSAKAQSEGYTMPAGGQLAWTFPTTATTCQIQLCSGLQTLLGLTQATTYPLTPENDNYTANSISTPKISPVSSIMVCCSIVNNGIMPVNTFLCQIPVDAAYGNTIKFLNSMDDQVQCIKGDRSEIMLQLLDQDWNPLMCNDREVAFTIQYTPGAQS